MSTPVWKAPSPLNGSRRSPNPAVRWPTTGQSDGVLSESASAGSGVSAGAETDSLFASVSRRLAQSLQGSASVNYSHSTSLDILSTDSLDTTSVVGSGQIGRALTRTISAYASYSASHQISQGVAQGISPLQGLVQTLGFGVTYSPSEVRLGRQ